MWPRTALYEPSAPTTTSAVAVAVVPSGRSKLMVPAVSSKPVQRWSNANRTFGCFAAARSSIMLSALRLKLMIARFGSETFLDWNEVRALHARGVTIGAHADRHWPMHAGQSQAWLTQQASGAKARIEAEVGPCRFFAYPFGNKSDVGAGAWKAVRNAGFSHGFTTLSGSLAAGDNPWLLPRYGLGPRDSHIASLVPLLFSGNPRLRRWQASLG